MSHFMDGKPHWLMNELSMYLYSHILCSHISYCHVPIFHTPVLPSHYIHTFCGDRYVCDIAPCRCSVQFVSDKGLKKIGIDCSV